MSGHSFMTENRQFRKDRGGKRSKPLVEVEGSKLVESSTIW